VQLKQHNTLQSGFTFWGKSPCSLNSCNGCSCTSAVAWAVLPWRQSDSNRWWNSTESCVDRNTITLLCLLSSWHTNTSRDHYQHAELLWLHSAAPVKCILQNNLKPFNVKTTRISAEILPDKISALHCNNESWNKRQVRKTIKTRCQCKKLLYSKGAVSSKRKRALQLFTTALVGDTMQKKTVTVTVTKRNSN